MSAVRGVGARANPSLRDGGQFGLFDTLAPSIAGNFSDSRHIALDATSWVEHIPGWRKGSGQLFDELFETAPWEQRDRWMFTRQVVEPRLTVEYPPYLIGTPGHAAHHGRSVGVALRRHVQSVSLQPASGDLIVIGGRRQRDWRHSVLEQATKVGARISVNFATVRP